MRNDAGATIIDSGPLFASLEPRDANHAPSSRALQAISGRLVFPEFVIAETLYLVESRLGPSAQAEFIDGLHRMDIVSPHPDDWPRIAELIRRYQDLPLGAVDASVIALAEGLGIGTILTLDRRHFSVVRPRHVPAFRILPE